MKIAAPVSRLEEMEMLLHFGADELYAGLRMPEWDNRFGRAFWINRRDPVAGNFFSFEGVKQATALAHEHAAAFYIAVNSPFYPPGSILQVLEICERLVENARIDGLIVSDLHLLLELGKAQFPVRIHLSSLGACTNSESVEYYRSLGVKRVILPRHLRLSEIESIVSNCEPDMEFEVFAINDGCYFEEGLCQTSHAFGPFCMTPYTIHAVDAGRGNLSKKTWLTDTKDLEEFLWHQNNCGCSFQADGLPNGPCSLCWFAEFRNWGITAVKIIGREASFYRKLRSLQMVKLVMEEVRKNVNSGAVRAFARNLRNTPQFCDKGYMCYFREK
jgi:U32 family peptidase